MNCSQYYYIPLTAFFQDNLGRPAPELSVNHSGLYWSKRWRGGSGISWTICKSFAPRSRKITMPVPHQSAFIGRMPFLLPNQQHQSTEGKNCSYMCAYHCAQLSYTTWHRTVLIIFPLILQTIILTRMMST